MNSGKYCLNTPILKNMDGVW